MKLNQKALLFIGLPWVVYLGLTFFTPIRYSSTAYVLLSIICIGIILTGCRYFIISRIEKLNQEASPTTAPVVTPDIPAYDEIAHLSAQINTMRETIYQLHAKQIPSATQTETINPSNLATATLSEKNRHSITQMERYDEITSLPNRIFFNEILNKTMSLARRHQKILAVLFIDIDGFKNITSTLGENAANDVLKELGLRISANLRTEDVLAKLDGDEFIILLSDITKPKFASTVAEKLLKTSAEPFKIGPKEISITTSIGISIYPNDGVSLENLLENADRALYKSKQTGGNCYQFHTQEMDAEAREYIQMETALRNAIKNNELALYYQPKIQINKGDIVGVEALLRWEHPALGIIGPDKFIPLAEETGLIHQIGEWALREACKASKFWHEEGYEHTTIAVNLSAKQFLHAKMAETIASILYETGLNPRYLELEITETAVMQDAEAATAILNALKSTGVRISLDHFGTGYTSISHLKRFPISSIKIDQSFIKGIPNTPNDTAITGAVVALAHNLGLEVVAEGVETAEQIQALGLMNCDIVQGYFLSHPLPAQKIMLQFKKLIDTVF